MRNIRNCPVAVIGGAGFLGSHCVDHLINKRNCSVTVVDNLCAGKLEFVHPKAKFVHHDITLSEEFLRSLFVREKIKYVLNYAAWPYIPDSFERPLAVFAVNATGALHVINAAQEAGVEAILQVSSAEIYGEPNKALIPSYTDKGVPVLTEEFFKIDENHRVTPHSSYGAAKAAIDAMVQVRWREAKTPVIALRQFNCVGERDILHPYVVPAIIDQLKGWEDYRAGYIEEAREEPPATVKQDYYREYNKVKLGNNSSRDFMYAGDAVAAAVELLEKGAFGEVFNLGSENSIKIYDLAHLIGKLMGFQQIEIHQDPERVRPWEIWHLQSDNSKIYSVIDYRPKTSLEEALQKTIRWIIDNPR